MAISTTRIHTISMVAIDGLSMHLISIWTMMVLKFRLSGLDGCTTRYTRFYDSKTHFYFFILLSQTDLPPDRDGLRPKYKWMLDHSENLSGKKG